MKHILCLGLTIILLTKNADADVTPDPLCPYPSDDYTRTPYEGDCTKYWECYQGQRYPMSCPDGFEFNAEQEICDFPESANCDSNSTVTYPTFTQTTGTSPGTTGTSPATTATTPGTAGTTETETETTAPPTGTTITTTTVWTPDPICPYPSDDLTFVPYPTNCSLYWECYQGDKYLMECPNGLVFNSVYNYCDYPERVDCSHISTTEETTETSPTTPTTESTTTTATTTTTEPDNICTGAPDGTFLRDPDDCNKYYECLHGKPIEGTCPPELVWNEEKLSCDYPENVDCDTSYY